MKRYLTFFGSEYYPFGGMHDFLGDFDTIDEGIEAANKEIEKHISTGDDLEMTWETHWAHIYDLTEARRVWSKNDNDINL